jgi:aryl-alcohol dehydrogenase-like predicted oxidoreductase
METKRLGHSDLEITRVGIGAWAMGGPGYAFAWGAQDDDESIQAIHAGLDSGMNWIDTAAVYGLGHSERIVAKALSGLTDPPYVFTKCERVWNEQGEIGKSLKAESIRKECEASLERLGVERIDLYQIHWPEPNEDIEEGWTTLAELQKEGKIRHIGVSNFSAGQMAQIAEIAPITSLQPPFSLIRREIEAEVLPYCGKEDIGVIVYSPMASGLLSGSMTRERIATLPSDDWRSRSAAFKEPQLTKNLGLADRLRSIGGNYGVSAGAVAIAWTLAHPAVTAAIVGLRNPTQVAGVAPAADLKLSGEEIAELSQMTG